MMLFSLFYGGFVLFVHLLPKQSVHFTGRSQLARTLSSCIREYTSNTSMLAFPGPLCTIYFVLAIWQVTPPFNFCLAWLAGSCFSSLTSQLPSLGLHLCKHSLSLPGSRTEDGEPTAHSRILQHLHSTSFCSVSQRYGVRLWGFPSISYFAQLGHETNCDFLLFPGNTCK